MRIDKEQHSRHPWKVHGLAADFELEDLWQFPISASPERGHSLSIFREKVFLRVFEDLGKRGLAGWLFRLRGAMGRLFGWDRPGKSGPTGFWERESVRARYLRMHGNGGGNSAQAVKDAEGEPSFRAVYELEDEYLTEISNQTVHALLHLGWVPLASGKHGVQMAVYVKKRGLLGRVYMKLIKPFRLWIVYPTMMRLVGREWRRFAGEPAL